MALSLTPGDIIRLAFKDAQIFGVGQTPLGEDTNDAFITLNMMMAQWQRKRWLVYHLVTHSITSTGAQSYTIGPSGDINVTVRPDLIDSAFFRQLVQSSPNQIDYPLEILTSREDYNNIALKQLRSFPMYLYYDAAYPLGVLYPWPIMQAAIYSLHVSVKEILAQFSSVVQTIVLPDEYMAALRYNLAVRLAPQYGAPALDDIKALARDALNVIRKANAQVPRLLMPQDLIRPGVYNPYSDQIR